VRRARALLAAGALCTVVLAGCGGRPPESAGDASLDVALEVHRVAVEVGDAAHAIVARAAGGREMAGQATQLQGDAADAEQLVREDLPTDGPAHAPLLAAAEATLAGARALPGLGRAPTADSAAGLERTLGRSDAAPDDPRVALVGARPGGDRAVAVVSPTAPARPAGGPPPIAGPARRGAGGAASRAAACPGREGPARPSAAAR
jgi:hypothetical protein